jgi:GNAT superfamily N-acetyltransferase
LRKVRALAPVDRDRLADVVARTWGSTLMDTRGRLVDILTLPGFIAEDEGEWLGYAAYETRDSEVEVLALEALVEGKGAGSAVLAECVRAAIQDGARRVWLLTSNDNMDALRFYQRRGFVLVAVHRDAVTRARETIKPEISLIGKHDIPLRDEIELELPRTDWANFVDRYSWPTT